MARIAIPILFSVALAGCGGNIDPASVNVPSPDVADNPRPIDGVSTKLITPLLKAAVSLDIRSGFVVVAARDGKIQYATNAGFADIAAQKPLLPTTRIRIASMTKPVTAVATMRLIEQGALRLDDPVAQYIPAFADIRVATSPQQDADGNFTTRPAARALTVADLLEFRAGMGATMGGDDTDLDRLWSEWRRGERKGLAQRVDYIATLPLQEDPGQRWRYGRSLDVMARIVEIVSGQAFEDYLQEHIFEPLGMANTSFMPPPGQRDNLAQHYTYDNNGDLIPAEDGPWDAKARVSGSGGLVSTAEDYLRFALMLWNRGSYGDEQIIAPETHALMTTNRVDGAVLSSLGFDGLGWGLGLSVVRTSDGIPFSTRDGDYWWSGYYGTHFWVSPETGLVMVAMVQHDPKALNLGRGQAIPYIVQELLFRAL